MNKLLLWFDVEDYINDAADTAFSALLDMLNENGVRASFKMVAEKARKLQERGRFDILEKLAAHDICYHTENHSVHPVSTEYCEKLPFRDGVLRYEQHEAKGLDAVRQITGKHPHAYGQPGASWSPCAFPVLKKYGVDTYLDQHEIIRCMREEEGGIYRYDGILTAVNLLHIMRPAYENSETGLETAKAEFERLSHTGKEKNKIFSIYYHPCEFIHTKFWDGLNYPKGKNLPVERDGSTDYIPGDIVGYAEMSRRIAFLSDFIKYVLSRGDTEFITADQLSDYERKRSRAITEKDIQFCAESALKNGIRYVKLFENGEDETDGYFYLSASEQLILFSKYLNKKALLPCLVFGPSDRSESFLKTRTISRTDLAHALETFDTLYGFPQMKTIIPCGENMLSPAMLFTAAALAVTLPDAQTIALPDQPLACVFEDDVDQNDDYHGKWLFDDDFRIPNIIKYTCLQAWTLKPAVF